MQARAAVVASLLAALLAVPLGPLACGGGDLPPGPPLVAVSILPQAWFVNRIAGDRVEVAVMIPPGASPDTYEPGLEQLRAVSVASLYVAVGHPKLPFERAWLGHLLAERRDLPVVDAAAGIEGAEGDPHLWVSPRHARAMARNIAAGLAAILPGEREALEANLEQVLAEIDAVDADLRAALAGVRGAKFFVFHPAWGHFAEDYGLVQVAIEQQGKEPDAKALARLIEEARQAGVRVVFAQPHFDPAAAGVIADEIGARVEFLDPLAYAWPENLRRVAGALADASRG